MNTVFQISRTFILLVFALFASNALSALVQSETGTASLDGAWTFGCGDPDIDEGSFNYEKEFLIYQGNTVESRVYLYATDDTDCTGGVVAVESEGPFDIIIQNDPLVQIEGWLGEDAAGDPVLVDPPATQNPNDDPSDLLNPTPLASIEIFVIPGEQDEEGCVYIDDTDTTQNGLNWYLYRCSGESDVTFDPFLDTLEPLIKAELPVVSAIPVPAGIWLFGTALIGFVGYSRRRKIG